MTNYLISWRKDSGQGVPGYDVSTTPAYMEIADGDTTYDLTKQKNVDVWLADLKKAGSMVLVFVHGFHNNAADVLVRHNAIKRNLPPGCSLVSFDWASGNPGFPPKKAYFADKDNATKTAPYLMSSCLQQLTDPSQFGSQRVHLFAHSMGAYLTETAFQAPKAIKINHVLMAAACVDQNNYQAGSTPLTNFLGKCVDLTAYWSVDDKALPEAGQWESYTPLGLKGFPGSSIPGSCYGLICAPYYEKYVTPKSPEMSHVWYILFEQNNAFYTDMSEVLRGVSTTPTRARTSVPNSFQLLQPAEVEVASRRETALHRT